MLTTNNQPIICTRCGWHNESAARMCGGCGQPLGTFGAAPINAPSGPRRADGSPLTSSGIGRDAPAGYPPGDAYSSLDPTRSLDYGTVASPQPGVMPARWPASAQPTQPAYAPSVQPAKRRGGSCLQRTLMTLLVLVVVTSCCGAGLWNFVFRPWLHTTTDSQIRTGLDTVFDEASNSLDQALPLLPAGTALTDVPIKAADLNTRIQEAAAKNGVPAGSQVHFIGRDGIQVTYLLSGKPHTATTHLYIVDGRIKARDTTDDFPLNAIESSSELETTINEALTHLTPSLHMTDLHMDGDTFYFSFTK